MRKRVTRRRVKASSLKRASEIFKEPKWFKCIDCKDDFSQLTEKRLCNDCEDRRKKRVERRAKMIKSVGEQAFSERRFNNLKKNERNREAILICKSFSPKMENLYLFGPCGVGKTHMAGAMYYDYWELNACVGNRMAFLRVTDFLRNIRGLTPQEEKAELRHYAFMKFLVLDDLGKENMTEWAQSMLTDLLDMRYESRQKGLVITSNLGGDDMTEKMGNDRLTSRISGMCKPVKIEDYDHRVED